MSKVILQDIGSGYNLQTVVNNNNTFIEEAFENTLSRDGTSPNFMKTSLDMNSHEVINLASPSSSSSAARWIDVVEAVDVQGLAAPSIVGNDGKFLGTDGLTTQWVNPPIYVEQTPAELAADVIPSDPSVLPGHRARYASLADAVAVSGVHPLYLFLDETITSPITLPDKAKIYGVGKPQITCSTAGAHIFDATSKQGIVIDGVRFKGADKTTVPGTGFDGFSGANNGLVTLTSCTDCYITRCEADTFYNGITAQNCVRTFVLFSNAIKNWTYAGLIGSSSRNSGFDWNVVSDGPQVAAVSYGIIATGNEAAGIPQKDCSISFNTIDGVPSWDAIMSHDCDGLVIHGNRCRNVRSGIDIGHLDATNIVKNVSIVGNIVISTTIDTWAAAPASHLGIGVTGYDATARVQGAVVVGNRVQGFYTTSGMVGTGYSGHIVVVNSDDVVVDDNSISAGGAVISNAGIYLNGTLNRVSVGGGTIQGTMGKGAVRCETVVGTRLVIKPSAITQDNAADSAYVFTGTTIDLRLDMGPNNSTTPFSQGTSTLTFSGDYLEGSATYDPPSLADGVGITTTVTVTGAVTGDFAEASFSGDTQGITVTAWVSAANTVSVRFQNESGGVLDVGSGTLRARVRKAH